MADYSQFLIIHKSKIHGVGVFTTKEIPPGAYLGSFSGTLFVNDLRYCVERINQENGMKYWIEGTGTLRYVNHSSTPNCTLKGNDLFALDTINQGDEITWFYGKSFEKELRKNIFQKGYSLLKRKFKKRFKW